MIFSKIENWKDLQFKICDLFIQCGFIAETEKKILTPRGTIEIDVYAYDANSIDKINYVIECKNWNAKVSQDVIHSFTTRMNEIGANIGYIISKKGFQKGAKDYTTSTNINLFTIEEIQSRYLKTWLSKHFCKKINDISSILIQYVEPINTRRERHLKELLDQDKKKFKDLFDKYKLLGSYLLYLSSFSEESQRLSKTTILNFPSVENQREFYSKHYSLEMKSDNYTELLLEIETFVEEVTMDFNAVFEENIFDV